MRDEILKYLHDIREAALAIKDFVYEKHYEDYHTDELLRSAVERKFEIIGEALNRLHKNTPEILGRIRHYRDIISFRNLLAHGYDSIDDQIVWGIIEEEIDDLLDDVNALLVQK